MSSQAATEVKIRVEGVQPPQPTELQKFWKRFNLFFDSIVLKSRSRIGFLYLFIGLRFVIVATLAVKFILFPTNENPLQIYAYCLYGLIVFGASFFPFWRNKSIQDKVNYHYIAILIDVLFFSAFVVMSRDARTEVYLFYLIPLITAAHFLKRRQALFITGIIMIAFGGSLLAVQKLQGNGIDGAVIWNWISRAGFLLTSVWLYRMQRDLPNPQETLILSPAEARDRLEILLDELKQSVNFDSASIQILYQNNLQIVACRGFEDPVQIYRIQFPIDNPSYPNYKVMAEKRPVFADGNEYPSFQNKLFHISNIQSWLGIPLISPSSGELFGMISLDSTKANAFRPEDAQVATWFANKAATFVLETALGPSALTISTKREALRVMAKRWVGSLPALLKWMKKSQAASDIQAAEEITRIAKEIFFVEDCSLYFTRKKYIGDTDAEAVVLHLVSSTAIPKQEFNRHESPVTGRKGDGLTGYAVRRGKVINFSASDVEASPYHGDFTGNLKYLDSKRCKQILIAPLRNSLGRTIGALKIENKLGWSRESRFPLEERYLFESFAHLAGLLLEEIRQRNYINRQRSTIHHLRSLLRENVIRPMDQLAEEAIRVENHSQEVRWKIANIHKALIFTKSSLDRFLLDPAEDMILENDGLIPALHSYISNLALGFPNFTQVCSRIQFSTVEPRDNLPFKLRVAFYNVGREALMNVIRHSKIEENPRGKASVVFTRSGGKCSLVIEDNGVGFAYDEKLADQTCFGLDDMKTELDSVEGDEQETGVTFTPGKEGGTRVTAVWKPAREGRQE